MVGSLNLFNYSTTKELYTNNNSTLSRGTDPIPSSPGQLPILSNSLIDAKNQTPFLFALGLNANQLQSDAVRQFVTNLSGQNVNVIS